MENQAGVRICKACKTEIPRIEVDRSLSVCTKCGSNMRFHVRKRIKALEDPGTFKEWAADMEVCNPLEDAAYEKQIAKTQEKHKIKEAIVIGEMNIHNKPVAVGVMDTRFMMASMGYLVGEKVTILFEKAKKKKLPVILFCCSGGARMQEGIISLMQMEKTSAAVKKHSEAGLLYISVLTNPTMGGVTASYATLADIVLAEKGAMIGFAGPRVIEQNTGVKLPKGFQTAEFQREHGFVDAIVERHNMRDYFGRLLEFHKRGRKKADLSRRGSGDGSIQCALDSKRTAWEKVQIARAKNRPTSIDYIKTLFDDFTELSGDRVFADDHAIVAGIARFHGLPVTVIGQQKGKESLQQAVYHNWGMASPSGYRKALRLMKQAEKFDRPIICFIDTIGAACGKEAEEQGQGAVIAHLLQEMSVLTVPVLSIIIGEGGSGGALALAVGNEVWMFENAVYSILSPEGYASILWKDSARAEEAAEIMKLEASNLYGYGVVDRIIAEPEPVTKENIGHVCKDLDLDMQAFLKNYSRKSSSRIAKDRYKRFRKF